MTSETVVKRLSYVPSPATMKPCAVDGELCQPFPERDSEVCSWHFWLQAICRDLARTEIKGNAMRDAARCACDCHNWGAPGWRAAPCAVCIGGHEIRPSPWSSTCLVTTGPTGPVWCVTHGCWFNPPAHSPLSEDFTAPVAAVASPADGPLAARKSAETKIEVVFAQLESAEELALLYRLLRRRGWSDDRSDAVLHKARW